MAQTRRRRGGDPKPGGQVRELVPADRDSAPGPGAGGHTAAALARTERLEDDVAPRLVPTDLIEPSPLNPRRFRADAAFEDLKASLRAHGMLQAIVLRPVEMGDGTTVTDFGKPFEIICGERRWRAARELGWLEVAARVIACDAVTAHKLRIAENRDRQELSYLEQARAVDSLLGLGLSIEAAAAEIGMSPQWAARRRRLLELAPCWAAAIEDPDHWAARWPVASIEKVARLPPDVQEQCFKKWGGENPLEMLGHWQRSIAEGRPDAVEAAVLEVTCELRRAPWDLEDATLDAEAGACTSCPHRSDAQPLLWGDEDGPVKGLDGKPLRREGRCLRPRCFAGKLKLFEGRKLEQVASKYALCGHPGGQPRLLHVVTDFGSSKEAVAAARRLKLPVFDKHAVKEVKAGTSGAMPAVKIGERGVGKQVVWIRTHEARKAAGEKLPDTALPGRTQTPAETRAQWVIEEWFRQLEQGEKKLAAVTQRTWDDVHRLRLAALLGLDANFNASPEQVIGRLAADEPLEKLREHCDRGLLSAMHGWRWEFGRLATGLQIPLLAKLELHGLCAGNDGAELPRGWKTVAELEAQALRRLPDKAAGEKGKKGKAAKAAKAGRRKKVRRGQAK